MPDGPIPIRIELTAGAQQHVARSGIDIASAVDALDARVQVGDRISFGGELPDDFAVIRRQYVVANGTAALVLVLDHPART